jgi:ParB family transcriptional regulator, chromosome partitioning protein
MNPIANVKGMTDIPLDDLEFGMSQARLRNISKEVDELADSIFRVGLIEPIVVVESPDTPGKYQILTGQRRYQAHRRLADSGRLENRTIRAMVLDRAVDDVEAKVISLTENSVRLDLGRPDVIDAMTWLYKRYGTVSAVHEATGISIKKIQDAVKFDRLIPELKAAVNNNEVRLDAALKAQDAANAGRETPDPEEALKLAKEMSGMIKVQQDNLKKSRIEQPDAPIDDVIEDAKTRSRVTQIIVTISGTMHEALQRYADSEGMTQDAAAFGFIESGLVAAGYAAETE